MVAAIAFLLLSAAPALAHELDVFASVEGKTIHGHVHSGGQTPAQHVAVTALGPKGEKLGQTATDEQGEFSLPARFRCDHRLLVRTADGHGAEFTVTAGQLPKDLPPLAETPGASQQPAPDAAHQHDHDEDPEHATHEPSLEALHTELQQLREDIHQSQRRMRFTDILGAIGYIVGITGAAYYYLGAKRNRASV